MKLFLVKNKAGQYLFASRHFTQWLTEDKASIYHSREDANYAAINGAYGLDDNQEPFEIIEVDTDAGQEALRILSQLNSIIPLEDCIYDVREHEGQGWEGPKVKAWGGACIRMTKLLEKFPCLAPTSTEYPS
jgi:hypothetical protein